MYEDKGRREDKSPCSKVKNIADIMVKKLEHLIEHPSVRRRAEQRLPDVIIAGVKKCGTGSLIEMLKLHPNIVAPDYEQTENNLFDDDHWEGGKGIQNFVSKMARGLPEQLIVTKSQTLLTFPHQDVIYTKLQAGQANFPTFRCGSISISNSTRMPGMDKSRSRLDARMSRLQSGHMNVQSGAWTGHCPVWTYVGPRLTLPPLCPYKVFLWDSFYLATLINYYWLL